MTYAAASNASQVHAAVTCLQPRLYCVGSSSACCTMRRNDSSCSAHPLSVSTMRVATLANFLSAAVSTSLRRYPAPMFLGAEWALLLGGRPHHAWRLGACSSTMSTSPCHWGEEPCN